MTSSVQKIYGNKVRVRVCGLFERDNSLLLVNHEGLGNGNLWAPPGGGIEFGETAADSLHREFLEETGLDVDIGDFLFACEFIHTPLHAIELFFSIKSAKGKLETGIDPEMESESQLITKVQFIPWKDLKRMDPSSLHGMFKYVAEPKEIIDLRGYFKL